MCSDYFISFFHRLIFLDYFVCSLGSPVSQVTYYLVSVVESVIVAIVRMQFTTASHSIPIYLSVSCCRLWRLTKIHPQMLMVVGVDLCLFQSPTSTTIRYSVMNYSSNNCYSLYHMDRRHFRRCPWNYYVL